MKICVDTSDLTPFWFILKIVISICVTENIITSILFDFKRDSAFPIF